MYHVPLIISKKVVSSTPYHKSESCINTPYQGQKKDRQHNVQKKDRQLNSQKKDRQHNDQKKDRQHNGQKKDRQHNGQKKDRQHNGQKKIGKKDNNDLQNLLRKLKIE